ncbi:ABC transporter permease subunit [Halorubrum sp. JWXQ-INN 858]|uniref:ABC transporter permease subunit n=1 Tax=Halorubrum sp. JWXQ-INN 858 TaxID=2690782 RepID=UPI00135C8262|nr:ABC transporter permease subunit [Halorubrum sp. JWXQ-INN 858]MWV64675.1 ABC transporter permease subunit [Halorubrum sp. JWXQ-INN 858]
MTAILRNEARGLRRGPLALVGVLVLFSVLYFSIYPDFADDAEALDGVMEAFPEGMIEFFGIEAIHTIEGFIAAEMYSFFWVVLVGIYFAYVSAGMIAGDVESRKMDLTLSTPVSRESVIAQKAAALAVPLVVLNVGVGVVVYVGALSIGESFDPVALTMVHLLSVPYLLVCAGIGLVLSVVVDRQRTAQAAALVAVFMLWLVEGASNVDPDYEWIGYVTPSRYYDETAILVREEYAFLDAAILLAAFVLLVLLAAGLFVRRDI